MTNATIVSIGFICLLFATCLSSCKSREEKAAEAAVKLFEALENHQFDEASAYVTEDTYAILESVADEAENYQPREENASRISYEVVNRKIGNDTGELTVTITAGKRVRTEIIPVVWVNNAWKVKISRKHLSVLHLVTFNERFELIVVEKRKQHPGKGHAYGHRTHKHKR
jgi:hypothetical protein